jgi:hypothetical protein
MYDVYQNTFYGVPVAKRWPLVGGEFVQRAGESIEFRVWLRVTRPTACDLSFLDQDHYPTDRPTLEWHIRDVPASDEGYGDPLPNERYAVRLIGGINDGDGAPDPPLPLVERLVPVDVFLPSRDVDQHRSLHLEATSATCGWVDQNVRIESFNVDAVVSR